MKETTLCYIEQDGCYLMLYRNRKENDCNEGKWIGVGGKIEAGESPDECVIREVKEETGLDLISFKKRGIINFQSNEWENEIMHLYTADAVSGELTLDCNEGELHYIPLSEIMSLNLWEGDRIFLKKLIDGESDIYLTLQYKGDMLANVIHEV